MRIDFHRNFDKKFVKLTKKQQVQFKARLIELSEDQYKTVLNNHSLKGEIHEYRSIYITGEVRAIIPRSENHVELIDIGSHSQLYG